MSERCQSPIPLDELLAYRLGELEAAAEQALEAHYFGRESCAERLSWAESLERGVVAALAQGLFDVTITRKSVERLERAGSVLRKYEMHPGESVNCTSGPDDDMTVVTLHPPLRPNVPVTVMVDFVHPGTGAPIHEERPAFQDQTTGEVVIARASEALRPIGHLRFTLSVRLGEGPTAETAGPFVMNHSPWAAQPT